ncbi:MAG TPA: MmgE/PrpD family protein [Porticoccaceae bacterium]|nr:MmgE/PrpD family protein [Pseudomonadota bacterium]HLS97926.1 MmgE/PrpD family protein [Porticoccaceae bacterium]
MTPERTLAHWLVNTRYQDLPQPVVAQMKLLVKTIIGTTVAGATAEGCLAVVEQVRDWGGKGEATVLIHGGAKVPAHNAVLANSVMGRALDICDGMAPGIHIGTSVVPIALAMAEAVGGCTGEELITALAVGTELSARISAIAEYDGFDPTGIGTQFGAAAVAGRLLKLDASQIHHALALAFNRAAGSFQSNIDGSLAVRFIQGFVSQNGVICAQLAQRGITGPDHYITGLYGYYHLFCKDRRDQATLVDDLGNRWNLYQMGFKSAPSCGCTIAPTDLILDLVNRHPVDPDAVARIDVTVGPPVFKLTGHDFEVGDNPTVNAQFNIQYCVANGLLRRASRLEHFDPARVTDPAVLALTKRIKVHCDDTRITETTLVITTRDGETLRAQTPGPSGFPPFPLTDEQHRERFEDNIGYGGKPLPRPQVDALVARVAALEGMADVRDLIPLLVAG